MNGMKLIDRYIEAAGLPEEVYEQYGMGMEEYVALLDEVSAEYMILTAYAYGMARGYCAGRKNGGKANE